MIIAVDSWKVESSAWLFLVRLSGFIFCRSLCAFAGVLAKTGRKMWFFCGELVVDCW
jgi:hypothetical protein